MFKKVDYQRLRQLLEEGAQLVEVLPAEEYEEEHLPGAINIPLKELNADSTAKLDDLLRDDVVRSALADRIEKVRAEVEASRYGFALVVDENEVLLGRLRRSALEGDGAMTAEEAMEAGPSTIRADTSVEKLRERLEGHGLNFAVVTTPDGVLIGIVCRADLSGV
jgi:rhodanese-related sulfurtransferase